MLVEHLSLLLSGFVGLFADVIVLENQFVFFFPEKLVE